MTVPNKADSINAPSLPPRPGFVITAIVTPLVIPFAVYEVVALGAGLGIGEATAATWSQVSGRPNLLTSGLLTLIPMVVFLGALALLQKRDPKGRWLGIAAWAGLVPSLALLVWANVEVWPLFLPGRTFPGFPHGIELIIVPLFFVPAAMVTGVVFGALMGRLKR